jgi:(S)-2-hydroxyglutarate dehydrogenase
MQREKYKYDVVIAGAGIIGMSVAYEFIKRDPDLTIAIVDKEFDVAQHASGWNSGVLHAGFYYGESSLKAKFCVEGNRLMKEFCKAHQLAINENKKVVVARNEQELETLQMLYERGIANGVTLTLIDEQQLKAIDPSINTYKKALLSPTTATVDPKSVSQKLKSVLKNSGVCFFFNEEITKFGSGYVASKRAEFHYRRFINSAGMYALKLAHKMGLKTDYVTLPFKGAYLKGVNTNDLPNINIYPVPDMRYPFLGVHVTASVDGAIKLGPTAIPAFWYEQYKGFSRFRFLEFCQVLFYYTKMMLFNIANIRRLAFREMRYYRKSNLVSESKELLDSITHKFDRYPAGIRAQLFDRKKKKLEMDFVIKKQGNICHVLNAVSPGFTCSFSFAKYIVDQFN